MKAAAIIALLVAIVLGIAAIGNYVDDNAKRDEGGWPTQAGVAWVGICE